MNPLHSALDVLVSKLEAECAVVSPGSRNAPVISALLRQNYRLFSAIDERSAGFEALGMAKASRKAVVLSCTSGTAALNYYPAIAEAFYARIPLIVLTADRPPERIDQWEGQAIRQVDLYKTHCRLNFNLDLSHDLSDQCHRIATQINEYFEEEVRGPVHVNIPIREPFYNENSNCLQEERRVISNESILLLDMDDLIPPEMRGKKILLVNGMEDGQLMIAQCRDGEQYENLVVLSDICSNLDSSVQYWDLLLQKLLVKGSEAIAEFCPDILVTTGTTVVSKALKTFLTKYKPKHHFHITRHKEVGDPFDTKPQLLDPYLGKAEYPDLILDPTYAKLWLDAAEKMSEGMESLNWSSFSELSAHRFILANLPANASLHLSNSMPVRYASYVEDVLGPLEVFCNRGTSGIDGCTSTALGHAQVVSEDVYLITGDIGFMYDINAFLRDDLPNNLKVIVINNEGGRIFEFIEGPSNWGHRQHYQVTPHQRNMQGVCQHFGLEYFCARNFNELRKQLDHFISSSKCSVLELMIDSAENAQMIKNLKELQL